MTDPRKTPPGVRRGEVAQVTGGWIGEDPGDAFARATVERVKQLCALRVNRWRVAEGMPGGAASSLARAVWRLPASWAQRAAVLAATLRAAMAWPAALAGLVGHYQGEADRRAAQGDDAAPFEFATQLGRALVPTDPAIADLYLRRAIECLLRIGAAAALSAQHLAAQLWVALGDDAGTGDDDAARAIVQILGPDEAAAIGVRGSGALFGDLTAAARADLYRDLDAAISRLAGIDDSDDAGEVGR